MPESLPSPPEPPPPARNTPTPGDKQPWRGELWMVVLSVLAVAFMILIGVRGTEQSETPRSLEYSALLADVRAGSVTSVTVHDPSGRIDVLNKDGSKSQVQGPAGGIPDADVAVFASYDVGRNYRHDSSGGSGLSTLLSFLLPIGLIVGLWLLLTRSASRQLAGAAKFGKTTAKVQLTPHTKTTFNDIAGYEGVKEEIREVVDFLVAPDRFKEIGARIPKGVLLVGPPGTGKTLFARAIAGEAGVAFLSITGSEFMEMYVGVGAARVRDLFQKAREHAPSIVFVDELDAIGRKRGTGIGGGHDEREQTLNQLLSEMDGFEVAEGIVVLAATNRPDVLDPALLRAGRFDRQVVIPLPTQDERRAILTVHSTGKRLGPDVDLDVVARGTPGMSGAELANVVNEAALIAVRRGSHEVTSNDFEAARERVLIGIRRASLALTPEEKRIVAYHEAGHALVADVLEHSDRVVKVSILPTGMALGVTQQLPIEERMLQQLPYVEDALAVRLAGRAAEQLVFGTVSTGAHDDLVSATELARRMVREWGMSAAFPHMAWGSEGPVFLGEDLVHTREYSDDTARIIDEEIERLLDEQARRADVALDAHHRALDRLAAALLERESLEGREVMAILTEAEPALSTSSMSTVP